MERTAMPANELEGLIRDRLPDAVRRNLMDVQIDRIDRDDSKPNWIGMPIWETDPSDDDKRKFLATPQGKTTVSFVAPCLCAGLLLCRSGRTGRPWRA